MNSITANITREDMIAEIKLLLDADITHKKVVIVVEGLDDIKFINSMCFDSDNTVMQSYSGKIGVLDIIDNYKEEKRVIAILDRDYSISTYSDNVFYYDYCCLEMMLISNNDNFANIYNEYVFSNKWNYEKLRLHCLNQLRCISFLRKINWEKGLGINFKKLSINNLYNCNEIRMIDFEEMINQRYNNFFIENEDLFKEIQFYCKQEENYEELLNITNGHDFCEFLANIARENTGNGTSKEIIQRVLRCSYRKEDFCNTMLYKNLKKYEVERELKIFKRVIGSDMTEDITQSETSFW